MRTLLAAAVAVTMMAGPALAQDADKPVASKSDPETARLIQSYGHCLAAQQPELSHELVTMDHRTPQYRKLIFQLADDARRCKGYRRGFASHGLVFAGAVAEGLLAERGILDRLAAATAYDPDAAPIEARSWEDVFAYCMVRKDPTGVAALLGTDFVSDEELAVLKAMASTMPTCVPAGQQPKFTREALRSLLALSSYRLYAHGL